MRPLSGNSRQMSMQVEEHTDDSFTRIKKI